VPGLLGQVHALPLPLVPHPEDEKARLVSLIKIFSLKIFTVVMLFVKKYLNFLRNVWDFDVEAMYAF